LLGLFVGRLTFPKSYWLPGLLVIWFFWQLLASTLSIDKGLSRLTVIHFGTCLLCFGIGQFALRRSQDLLGFAAGLLPFFLWMLWIGFEQHFGGLAATERMILQTPNYREAFPPEYLERIAKRRIFATLVYPNALSGVILLFLPLLSITVWRITGKLTVVTRSIAVGGLLFAALACLVWSGSKSGWLIAIGLLVLLLFHLRFSRALKLTLVLGACIAGLAAFSIKYAAYFSAGASSLGARFDYWQAAWNTSVRHPFLGTGPGTFGRVYKETKRPESEMAHLVHNDWLEQACDSGIIGFLAYAGFWFGSMIWLYRAKPWPGVLSTGFACWLGLVGWCVQGFTEFGLYIPALSWPAFTLVGWLWGREIESTQEQALTSFAP